MGGTPFLFQHVRGSSRPPVYMHTAAFQASTQAYCAHHCTQKAFCVALLTVLADVPNLPIRMVRASSWSVQCVEHAEPKRTLVSNCITIADQYQDRQNAIASSSGVGPYYLAVLARANPALWPCPYSCASPYTWKRTQSRHTPSSSQRQSQCKQPKAPNPPVARRAAMTMSPRTLMQAE